MVEIEQYLGGLMLWLFFVWIVLMRLNGLSENCVEHNLMNDDDDGVNDDSGDDGGFRCGVNGCCRIDGWDESWWLCLSVYCVAVVTIFVAKILEDGDLFNGNICLPLISVVMAILTEFWTWIEVFRLAALSFSKIFVSV